jgi:hypothetical protein
MSSEHRESGILCEFLRRVPEFLPLPGSWWKKITECLAGSVTHRLSPGGLSRVGLWTLPALTMALGGYPKALEETGPGPGPGPETTQSLNPHLTARLSPSLQTHLGGADFSQWGRPGKWSEWTTLASTASSFGILPAHLRTYWGTSLWELLCCSLGMTPAVGSLGLTIGIVSRCEARGTAGSSEDGQGHCGTLVCLLDAFGLAPSWELSKMSSKPTWPCGQCKVPTQSSLTYSIL